MEMTPHELRTVELREAWRGYRQDDVDGLLDRVADVLEARDREQRRLRDRLARAEDALANGDRSSGEQQLSRALIAAQRAADELVAEAQEEAATERREAAAEARRVRDEARAESEALTSSARAEADELSTSSRHDAEERVSAAQARADALLGDAQERSTTMVADAEARSAAMVTQAEERAASIVSEARLEAARVGEARRREVSLEVDRLTARRSDLAADVAALERFVAEHRPRVRAAIEAELVRLEGGPELALPARPLLLAGEAAASVAVAEPAAEPEPVAPARAAQADDRGALAVAPEPVVPESVVESAPAPTAQPEVAPEPGPVAETTPEPEPGPVAETTPEPEPEPVAETTPEPEPEPVAEAAPESEPGPVAETAPEPEPATDLPATGSSTSGIPATDSSTTGSSTSGTSTKGSSTTGTSTTGSSTKGTSTTDSSTSGSSTNGTSTSGTTVGGTVADDVGDDAGGAGAIDPTSGPVAERLPLTGGAAAPARSEPRRAERRSREPALRLVGSDEPVTAEVVVDDLLESDELDAVAPALLGDDGPPTQAWSPGDADLGDREPRIDARRSRTAAPSRAARIELDLDAIGSPTSSPPPEVVVIDLDAVTARPQAADRSTRPAAGPAGPVPRRRPAGDDPYLASLRAAVEDDTPLAERSLDDQFYDDELDDDIPGRFGIFRRRR